MGLLSERAAQSNSLVDGPVNALCCGGGSVRTIHAGSARLQEARAVFVADYLIGFLVDHHRHGVEPVLITGASLGRYNSEPAAARALLHEWAVRQ